MTVRYCVIVGLSTSRGGVPYLFVNGGGCWLWVIVIIIRLQYQGGCGLTAVVIG